MVDLSSYFLEEINFSGLPAIKLNISREKKLEFIHIVQIHFRSNRCYFKQHSTNSIAFHKQHAETCMMYEQICKQVVIFVEVTKNFVQKSLWQSAQQFQFQCSQFVRWLHYMFLEHS